MKFCNHCHRITAGEPLFCNFCGRSYDLKLCPHRHPNPRTAEICSQCGSRELSTPHPHVPLWLAPLLTLLSALPGVLLLGLSILLLVGIIHALLTDPRVLPYLMQMGLILGLLWWLYMHLPGFLRKFITKLFFGRRGRNDHHGH